MLISRLKSKNYILFAFFLLLIGNFYSLKSNPKYITRSEKYYIVKKNDTLYSIGKKVGLPVKKIKLFNELKSNKIFVGQKIYLSPNIKHKKSYVSKQNMPKSNSYKVKKGDTLYRISKMFEIEIVDLLEYNDLKTFDISIGQIISLVPSKRVKSSVAKTSVKKEEKSSGIASKSDKKKDYDNIHIVKKGETLFGIARENDTSVKKIKKINQLTSNSLQIGQRLKIKKEMNKIIEKKSSDKSVSSNKKAKGCFNPLKGKIISKFGLRNGKPHRGIDIKGKKGDPIYAALDGKAVFVGKQRGYGNVIILEHPDFIMTVYAHNESNLIRLGDSIKKGQPIATVGQSGNAIGPHVHFEYRQHGKAIDPETVIEK